MTKPFLTIYEQIQKLKERDLIISDEEEAAKLFSLHSYYSVINGYKDIFICPYKTEEAGEDRFKDDVNLKEIIRLFELDIQFRKEILSILEVVESVLSNNIAYVLGERYGHKKESYLKKSNFRKGKKVKVRKGNTVVGEEFEIDRLFNELNKCYYSHEHPMKHYRDNHKNIPPWVLVKGLTFRNLYYIYKLFKFQDKNYLISRCIGVKESEIDEDLKEFFNKSLDLMIYYRNWAAHGNRIFSHRTKTELPFYEPAYRMNKITKQDHAKRRIGVNDLFALSIAIRYFLQRDKMKVGEYHISLSYYLRSYKEQAGEYYDSVLETMGFPANYHNNLFGLDEEDIFK